MNRERIRYIIRGCFFLLRPDALFGGVIWFLLGFYGAARTVGPTEKGMCQQVQVLSINLILASPRLALPLLAYTSAIGSILVANQVFDLRADRQNQKPLPLVDGSAHISHAWVELVCLSLIALCSSLLISGRHFVYMTLALCLGLGYSVPPVRLKARPTLDVLCFAVGYGLMGYMFGWISYVPVSSMFNPRRAAPYVLLAAAIHISTAIEDAPGDHKTGCETTVVRHGVAKSLLVSTILLVGSIALSIALRDEVSLVMAAGSLPWALYALYRRSLDAVLLLCRALGILSLCIPFVLFPLLAVAALLMFVLWGVMRFGSVKSLVSRRR